MNLTKDILILSETYQDIFLTEMQKRYIKMVEDIKDELPFDNIFGKNLRIIVPFAENESYAALKSELEKLPGFVEFNPEKKEVVRNVTFKRADTGETGTKPQTLTIGKAISTLKIPDEKKKQLLNWFSDYSSNISELERLSKYYIILSRHPIDVLRMSDVGAIQSCHAQGGMYFHCAIEEAKNGGPIAYLVDSEKIDQLDDKTFQTGEIFADHERNIPGIKAIARVRIRRYTDDDGDDYAIPETKVYGKKISGFLDSVKKFIKSKQQFSNTPEEIIQLFQKKKIIKRGGSYSDSSDSDLFNDYLDTNVLFGSLRHSEEDSEDSSQNRADQFDEELADMSNRYTYQHSWVGYQVENSDDYVYYYAWGSSSIDLSDYDVEELDFPDYDQEDFAYYYDLSSEFSRKHDIIHTNYRTKNLSKQEIGEILRFSKCINIFGNLTRLDTADFANITIKNTSWQNGSEVSIPPQLVINWKFNSDRSDGDISEDTDEFRYFCRTVKDHDDKMDDYKKAFIKALYQTGFLKATHGGDNTEKSEASENFQKFQDDTLEFENFQYDENEFEANGQILFNFTDEQTEYIKNNDQKLLPYIENFITKLYHEFVSKLPKKNIQQTSFKYYAESIQLGQPVTITVRTRLSEDSNYNNTNIYLNLVLEPAMINEEFVEFMIYFDKIFKNFMRSTVLSYILKILPPHMPMKNLDQEKQQTWLLQQAHKQRQKVEATYH